MTERLDDLDWPARIRLEYGALADGNPSVITILGAPDCLFCDYGAGLIQTMIGTEAFLDAATVLAGAAPSTIELLDVPNHHADIDRPVAAATAERR